MCLLVVAWRMNPRYPLIVAANRDEYHARAAAPLQRWSDLTGLFAGRDLQAGGTWLGAGVGGHFGIVTNYREPSRTVAAAPSRGGLIPGFFRSNKCPGSYLNRVETDSVHMAGFSLLLSDGNELWYASNRSECFARALPPGLYGLSNDLLDTPWPKVERLRAGLADWLRAAPLAEATLTDATTPLFELLADREPANTVDSEWSRILSAPFVAHAEYGTRCSTVALLGPHNNWIRERRFDASAKACGETELRLND